MFYKLARLKIFIKWVEKLNRDQYFATVSKYSNFTAHYNYSFCI